MSDPTRDPETPHDPELRAHLMAADPPEHGDDFWAALDDRLEVVAALRAVETPEHGERFWASFDARLRAEPSPLEDTAELTTVRATVRATVFEDHAPVLPLVRPRQLFTPRRLERLLQVSAVAASVAVLAGALAWWGTRDHNDSTALGARGTVTSTTVPGPPTTAVAAPLNPGSHVENVQPVPVRGSVPVGASPDGKFLYVAAPAPSNERCSFGSASNPLSTAAMWLYAQPVDGSTSHRILTDRSFADPKMTQGPSNKVVVSDSCNGSITHVIATAEPNGALSVDRVIPSASNAPLRVEGVAWSAAGTSLFLRGAGNSGWFRYELENPGLVAAPEIAPGAFAVEQLTNGQIVSLAQPAGTTTWSVSVGNQQVAAVNAPGHGDVARSVRVDARHGQLAIAGKETLLVLTAKPAGEVSLGQFQYAAEAVAWTSDGVGLVAAPNGGGLDYLTFAPSAAGGRPSTASLGFTGVAYSVLAVPDSASLVVRQGIGQGDNLVAGDALLLEFTS